MIPSLRFPLFVFLLLLSTADPCHAWDEIRRVVTGSGATRAIADSIMATFPSGDPVIEVRPYFPSPEERPPGPPQEDNWEIQFAGSALRIRILTSGPLPRALAQCLAGPIQVPPTGMRLSELRSCFQLAYYNCNNAQLADTLEVTSQCNGQSKPLSAWLNDLSSSEFAVRDLAQRTLERFLYLYLVPSIWNLTSDNYLWDSCVYHRTVNLLTARASGAADIETQRRILRILDSFSDLERIQATVRGRAIERFFRLLPLG